MLSVDSLTWVEQDIGRGTSGYAESNPCNSIFNLMRFFCMFFA